MATTIRPNAEPAATAPAVGDIFLIDGTTGVRALAASSVALRAGVTDGSNAATGNIGEYVEARFQSASATVTISIATPAVVNWPTNPYGGVGKWTAPIIFTTSGALPTGLTAGTVYWVIGSTLSGDNFQVATSVANALAGTAINTTGTQSGTQTGSTLQSLTTNTATEAAAISLGAGDWDVSAVLYGTPTNASTSVTDVSAYLSTVLGTADLTAGRFAQIFGAPVVPGVGTFLSAAVPSARFSLATPTTIHLVALALFTVSTMSMFGRISARRSAH